MLKTYEADSKKSKPQGQVLAVAEKKITKKKKGKKERNKKGKGKAPVENGSKDKSLANMECFYCKGKGHWKRNCRKYLNDKKSGTLTSGINLKISSLYLST